MSSFKSGRSKSTAESTVNSLLSNFLVQANPISINKKDKKGSIVRGHTDFRNVTSGAQQIQKLRLQSETMKRDKAGVEKLKRKEKKIKRKSIKKLQEDNQKVGKLAKLQESLKTLQSKGVRDDNIGNVIDKNIKSLESWDSSSKDELKKVQQKIIEMRNEEVNKRKKVKAKNLKKQDFERRVKQGVIAVAGLTPGLAPVGETDDEDSSDEEGEDGGDNEIQFEDDFDKYN